MSPPTCNECTTLLERVGSQNYKKLVSLIERSLHQNQISKKIYLDQTQKWKDTRKKLFEKLALEKGDFHFNNSIVDHIIVEHFLKK